MTLTGLLTRTRPAREPEPVLLPMGALEGVLAPRPDPQVFGPEDEPEPGMRDGWPQPEPRCGVHDVSWAGTGECWWCAAGAAG